MRRPDLTPPENIPCDVKAGSGKALRSPIAPVTKM